MNTKVIISEEKARKLIENGVCEESDFIGLKPKKLIESYIEVKNFRIYKWSKPVKDFKIPKGFRMAEEKEFVDLYDSGFKIEKYPVTYFTKNRSKLNIKNGLSLSRLYLYRYLNLNSNNDYLADSYEDGRVVCVKIGGKYG